MKRCNRGTIFLKTGCGMVLNILLVLLMVAALGGMVFCGRGGKSRPELQLIALLLLVLVIASGGMFMCRLGALSVLGLEDGSEDHFKREQKLREAQGFVIANFIRNSCPGRKKILLVSRPGDQAFNMAVLAQLRDFGAAALAQEHLAPVSPAPGADNLITPGMESAAESAAIEKAIARHPDADVIILAGVSPSGESLTRLKVARMPDQTRPKIIILGVSNLTDWFYRQIERGVFSAVVVTDLARSFQSDEALPENLVEVFNSRYVLVSGDNLKHNRRFFR